MTVSLPGDNPVVPPGAPTAPTSTEKWGWFEINSDNPTQMFWQILVPGDEILAGGTDILQIVDTIAAGHSLVDANTDGVPDGMTLIDYASAADYVADQDADPATIGTYQAYDVTNTAVWTVAAPSSTTLNVTIPNIRAGHIYAIRYYTQVDDGAPSPGESFSNSAVINGVTVTSTTTWTNDAGGSVVGPHVDMEKWNDEGSAPAYTSSGMLTNDGYAGDHDSAPATLAPAATTPIHFTVSNYGTATLRDVVVSDALTGGTGTIEGLVCTFPDGSTGTTWAGPFEVGVQFECTGTLPALGDAATHADAATVTAVGSATGATVTDTDEWHAVTPPVPAIDIEKWNTDDGETVGDRDTAADALAIAAGATTPISFTITNTGSEPLITVAVSDVLVSGAGTIADLTCTFPDGSTGTTWAGPFDVGAHFGCTGTVPALAAGDTHEDLASVTGIGQATGTTVSDSDAWHGEAAPAPTATPTPTPTESVTTPATTPPAATTPPGTTPPPAAPSSQPPAASQPPLANTGFDGTLGLVALFLTGAGGTLLALRQHAKRR